LVKLVYCSIIDAVFETCSERSIKPTSLVVRIHGHLARACGFKSSSHLVASGQL
jgi:hypothetical protein